VTPPFTSGTIPPSGTVDGVTYAYILDGGDWFVSSLSGKVLVRGDARLYVSSSLNLSGQDYLMITNGGSLKMYVEAEKASLGGQGVMNTSGLAIDFQYYGLPSNTSLSLSGNSAFVGVIYAPSAHLHLGGGGKDTYDFVGSSVTASVKMNGNFNFHYDESLASGGPIRGYIPSSWNEVNPLTALPSAAFASMTYETSN
jgi:hypothetical protein